MPEIDGLVLQVIYYRKAKEEGWRARSAFKLLQIDEEFNIFEGVRHMLDLCAAPGSWSQVLRRKLYLPAKLSPDSEYVLPMAPIEGVIQVQGDITNARTDEVDLCLTHEQFQLMQTVVITGLNDMDEFVQSQLILATYMSAPANAMLREAE
ncbi:tRNA (cytidine(32) guanosine(34)-2 -O)-methyltransferase [Olea europaea subsp. europaea]|uniref:tRNA (Cytidine(32) guanosine(34)-2 -O)-methyltransferase n=1 Tax=Olea europaea subsp. europaea TaxID=158383 RepID=A0A8S0PCY9_OLEEU|nr:tRNA (cytidine(32) guanosine(34)-2 -O)-methyltransferase [Olea europaea subsp. europaea]